MLRFTLVCLLLSAPSRSFHLLADASVSGDQASATTAQTDTEDLKQRVSDLSALVQALQARVSQLEKEKGHVEEPAPKTELTAQPGAQKETAQNVRPAAPSQPSPAQSSTGPLGGTTINLLFDGYYGYNFNKPIGRVNLLRAYDISSNAFSLNQAALVLENPADPANGKRFGLRLDLQYGQATETLQGNPVNEPRPEIYRNIFQAYGTYVFPVGQGLTVDFGKFASSLGIEGIYTKDQINYSRSYWFNFLPFYHMGARVNYKWTDKVALNYWITNGTQQTEPFNGFKDQFFGLTLQPAKSVTWNVNYYLGQEHPDVIFYTTAAAPPGLPTEQGIPFAPVTNAANGRLHILDTYATWQLSPRWSLAGEFDYVVERLNRNSPPQHVQGGALYAKYQATPKWALAARGEYLSDRGGLFSGATQALRETTVTADYKPEEGFLLRAEWRRDFSNHPYFLTDTLGILKKEQNTATLGLVWWFGQKQGVW